MGVSPVETQMLERSHVSDFEKSHAACFFFLAVRAHVAVLGAPMSDSLAEVSFVPWRVMTRSVCFFVVGMTGVAQGKAHSCWCTVQGCIVVS